MAQNYAETSSRKVDERFKKAALSESLVDSSYDVEFNGNKTVTVYDVDVVPEGDYTRAGISRYGTPVELGTGTQDLVMSQDKGTTYTIDRGNYSDSQYVTEAGKSFRRQTDEVYIPNTDMYRFAKVAAAAVANDAVVDDDVETSETTAYTILLDAGVELDEKKVPENKRVAYVTPVFYKFLKKDDSFIKNSELGQKKLITGQVGEVDGAAIVKVPTSLMPANVDLILARKGSLIAPHKIDTHKIHKDAPGISGWLIEVRRYFDAFVLKNKADGIAIHSYEAEA
jgi:N4-gp56 family major capsid protein